MSMLIDTEAHFVTSEFLDMLASRAAPPRQEVLDGRRLTFTEPSRPDIALSHPRFVVERLLGAGADRVALMDEHGIDVQVLSLSVPGVEQLEPDQSLVWARHANDSLAAAIGEHPDRFIGLATLAPALPEESADELRRCVVELGFRGANIHSHVGDAYLDDPRFRPIFAEAARLGVPISLHPTIPHGSMLDPYLGYGMTLPGPGLGFGHEVAVQVMRLIYSGLFDEHPSLQLMLGHLGESLPFWMYRLDFEFDKFPLGQRPKIERKPSEYLSGNCWLNCSGNFYVPALLAAVHAVGADRLMFAVDYPYETLADGVDFVRHLPLAAPDRAKLESRNAARLFGLDLESAAPATSAVQGPAASQAG